MQTVIDALSRSGFPFQTAVAHTIPQATDWSVAVEEFPWRDDNGADQFLDIVARGRDLVLGIECKKTKKDVLTFLSPSDGDAAVGEARCLYLSQIQDSTLRLELFCDRWRLTPSSVEATYCVVSTAGNVDQRLLERDAQRAVRGTDSYARHAKRSWGQTVGPQRDTVFVPTIVTTASLVVVRYDPSAVSLDTGEFASRPNDFSSVDWVRFTKPFGSIGGHDLGARTVFVVNALKLKSFLEQADWVAPRPSVFGRRVVPTS